MAVCCSLGHVCRQTQASEHSVACGLGVERCSAWEPRPPPALVASFALMPTSIGGPAPTESRQGRDKQRYGEDGARLVAGCIPVRYKGANGCADDVEVLLISSRGGKGWVFPKGGWEDDETVEAAAKRETVEEAGVRGAIEQPQVGAFSFQSGKQARLDNAHQGRCIAHIFVMNVGEELETWPEHPQRQRRWMSLQEASVSCRHQWMRDALCHWAKSRGWELRRDEPPMRMDSGSTSL